LYSTSTAPFSLVTVVCSEASSVRPSTPVYLNPKLPIISYLCSSLSAAPSLNLILVPNPPVNSVVFVILNLLSKLALNPKSFKTNFSAVYDALSAKLTLFMSLDIFVSTSV